MRPTTISGIERAVTVSTEGTPGRAAPTPMTPGRSNKSNHQSMRTCRFNEFFAANVRWIERKK
ncbi:MAG: hypothetical protein JWR32_3384 [Mycobacterium sp.]|jgi:hypothetical protein|nr:hypothetical protein [Mycobacterium sp.]